MIVVFSRSAAARFQSVLWTPYGPVILDQVPASRQYDVGNVMVTDKQ